MVSTSVLGMIIAFTAEQYFWLNGWFQYFMDICNTHYAFDDNSVRIEHWIVTADSISYGDVIIKPFVRLIIKPRYVQLAMSGDVLSAHQLCKLMSLSVALDPTMYDVIY